MAFVEDLSVFFADFGVPCTPPVGEDITVIFDRAHIETMGGVISATGPIALAVSTDVAAFAANSTQLQISGASYKVRDLQPDGTGLTLLILEAL